LLELSRGFASFPFYLGREAEGGLKRLSTGYTDLFQLHGVYPQTPVEKTLQVSRWTEPRRRAG